MGGSATYFHQAAWEEKQSEINGSGLMSKNLGTIEACNKQWFCASKLEASPNYLTIGIKLGKINRYKSVFCSDKYSISISAAVISVDSASVLRGKIE